MDQSTSTTPQTVASSGPSDSGLDASGVDSHDDVLSPALASLQVSSMTTTEALPLDKFECFPDLPKEIRLKIWNLLVPKSPRVISFGVKVPFDTQPSDSQTSRDTSATHGIFETRRPQPDLARICHESREVLSFAKNSPLFQNCSSESSNATDSEDKVTRVFPGLTSSGLSYFKSDLGDSIETHFSPLSANGTSLPIMSAKLDKDIIHFGPRFTRLALEYVSKALGLQEANKVRTLVLEYEATLDNPNPFSTSPSDGSHLLVLFFFPGIERMIFVPTDDSITISTKIRGDLTLEEFTPKDDVENHWSQTLHNETYAEWATRIAEFSLRMQMSKAFHHFEGVVPKIEFKSLRGGA